MRLAKLLPAAHFSFTLPISQIFPSLRAVRCKKSAGVFCFPLSIRKKDLRSMLKHLQTRCSAFAKLKFSFSSFQTLTGHLCRDSSPIRSGMKGMALSEMKGMALSGMKGVALSGMKGMALSGMKGMALSGMPKSHRVCQKAIGIDRKPSGLTMSKGLTMPKG